MPLVLLHPDRLPATEGEARIAPSAWAHHRLARRLVTAGAPAADDLVDRLRALPTSPAGMGLARPLPPPAASDVGYAYDDRLREYDTYFDVVRMDPAVAGVFPHAVLVAYRSLLEEGQAAGTRMSWRDWSSLGLTMRALVAFLLGVAAPDVPVATAPPPMLRWHLDPFRRWRIGHHVFFVLTQGLIVALNCLRRALADGDADAAARHLRLAARLLTGSAAAFVFTAEFSASQYQHAVRPSMESPHVSVGFSGLLSPDHQYLARLLARVRVSLRDLPPALRPDHECFVAALGSAYEAHKYVCARFGGDTGVSLRTSAATGLPGVEVLHGLKLARTRLVRLP